MIIVSTETLPEQHVYTVHDSFSCMKKAGNSRLFTYPIT